ncbi:ABC transporter substrate-binding protein [Asticcacaulis tiandongensis]|uniref:ABC transporter substrate-binding protein n=1 Tax=Asticcacaulis tiandongensis TaxID=2565365 RepID=UPI00112AF39A|nr:ABC transporter substrate-binding protein [Asticcacaulis tiandongensis]
MSRKLKRPPYLAGLIGLGVVLALILTFGTSQENRTRVTSGRIAPEKLVLSGTPEEQAALRQLYADALKNGEHQVVVYQAAVDAEWQPLWAEFSKTFPGIEVVYMHLSPTGVTDRLDIETATGAHYADVISQPVNVVLSIAERGYLQAYTPPTLGQLPEKYRGADDQVIFGFSKVYGLGYNTKQVKAEDLPQSIEALLSPEWQGRFEYGAPGGGAGTTDVALVNLLSRGRITWEDFLRLRDNGRSGPAQEGGVITIAQGRASLAPWVYLPPFERQQKAGAPIGIAYIPDFTLIVPFGQGIVKEPAHPHAAKLLVSWLLTPQGQKALAEKSATLGNQPNAPSPSGYPTDPAQRALAEPPPPTETVVLLRQVVPVAVDVWQGGDLRRAPDRPIR